mmetsp:Transcript_51604/g.121098  ORF Transcript_51604/g.121098 Transcript_51604/m.121098 type:complete len:236 (+) Transcript_51604:93-800(+)
MASYPERLTAWVTDPDRAVEGYMTAGTTLYFFVVCMITSDRKQRAWSITALSAGACFVAAIFVAQDMGWNFYMKEEFGTCNGLAHYVTRWFRAISVLDLVLGIVFYIEHLHILTSWIHHIAYFLLCNWLVETANGYCPLFVICCLEELPTFILALGSINKDWRSDFWFGSTFFVLRICLHSFLVWQVFTADSTDPRLGVVKFNFGLTISLHTHWFYGFIRQQLRLRKKQKKDAKE